MWPSTVWVTSGCWIQERYVFNHKDKKKGHQDTVTIFFKGKTGYTFRFPDTSNIRYGSHCDAAIELIISLDLWIEFLELIRDKKNAGTFNHMEQNIYKGLLDIPTLTELCVLVLYSQSISVPYVKAIHSPDGKQNVLDVGPLHDRVKVHCDAIIENSDLLLAADASYESGSLDGKPWERSDAFYAVKALMPRLPHLREATVAFFTGARSTWERFSVEFAKEGTIAHLAASDRLRAFMNTTNDINEGALGAFRVAMRQAPNMTADSHNARTMYKKNETRGFIRMRMKGMDSSQFLRRKARE
jgi:hypothetical protein